MPIISSKRAASGYSLPNDVDVTLIDPARNPKYSKNLHAFMTSKKHQAFARYARLFVDSDGIHWLGFADDIGTLVGTQLLGVLSYGPRISVASWALSGDVVEDENFWAEYLEDGRCALDREHKTSFVGDETRWNVIGDHRHCQWCDKVTQQRHRVPVTLIREEWRNQ